jgi:tRNA pseudouridine55 synthase
MSDVSLPPVAPTPVDFGRGGALLIDKEPGITSFGVIQALQRRLREATGAKRRDLPSLGHGGTLDPFATGLLVICVGPAVKLARYFLGSRKAYDGVIRFGESTVSGDLTDPVVERTEARPASLAALQNLALRLTLQPYLQTPPMHSAKKRDGQPLYELARQGIEVDREPVLCHLYSFDVESYADLRSAISVECSSGTYIRTLAQDFARLQGSLGVLESLHRTRSGRFDVAHAIKLGQALETHPREWSGDWGGRGAWVPFDRMLDGFARVRATPDEAQWLIQGRQQVLAPLLNRVEADPNRVSPADQVAIYAGDALLAVASRENHVWKLDRVFPPGV